MSFTGPEEFPKGIEASPTQSSGRRVPGWICGGVCFSRDVKTPLARPAPPGPYSGGLSRRTTINQRLCLSRYPPITVRDSPRGEMVRSTNRPSAKAATLRYLGSVRSISTARCWFEGHPDGPARMDGRLVAADLPVALAAEHRLEGGQELGTEGPGAGRRRFGGLQTANQLNVIGIRLRVVFSHTGAGEHRHSQRTHDPSHHTERLADETDERAAVGI